VSIPVAANPKAWATAALLLGLGGGCLCLVSVVCCQVEVSATGRSLIQRNPSECGVSVCGAKTSTKRRPRPARALEP
jgi:hypothetical protein